jgi:hypothetical protein
MKLLAESCWKVFWIKTHLNLTQEAANTVMRKKNENHYTQMHHYTTVRMEVPSAEYVEYYLAKQTLWCTIRMRIIKTKIQHNIILHIHVEWQTFSFLLTYMGFWEAN